MIIRDLLVKLGFQSDTGGLDKADRKIADMKGSIGALGVAAGNILSSLAQQGLGKGLEVIKDGVDQSVQFGREMANISSLIDGNQERTRELAGEVDKLSVQYGKSTTEINDGLYDLIGTLGDSKEAVSQLELAMKLGAAGAGTTKDGLAVLTAVTKAYGDTSMATMQKVADLASTTVNLGKITLPELAATIGQVTPLAATLGLSIEEVMANTATLTGVTGNGAMVMTQLSSAMRAVIDRTKPMEKAFQKAFKPEGIKSISQAIGKYGMVGTMQRLVKTTDGSIESVNGLFGRIEGLNEALAVTGKLSGDFISKQKAMANVAGTVDEQYKAQITGLGAAGHAMDVAKAQSDELSRQIGEKMTGAMMGVEQATLEVKKAFVDVMIPALMGVDSMFGTAKEQSDGFHDAMIAVRDIVLVVTGTLDAMLFSIKQVVAGFTAFTAASIQVATGDFQAAYRTGETYFKDLIKSGGALANRELQRYELIAGEAPSQTMERQQRQAAVMAARSVSMGDVNINVSAAPGTEASAVARELDTVVRNYMDQAMQQALLSTAPEAGGY